LALAASEEESAVEIRLNLDINTERFTSRATIVNRLQGNSGVGACVSFVIIAYNERENIGRALDAILALSSFDTDGYEVIVVNDGSDDCTAEVVMEWAQREPRIRLIDLPGNRGRGYARSTGTAAAQGEFIAMLDADIILPQDWLVRAKAALSGHDAVSGTAVPDGDATYVYQSCRLVPRVVGHTTVVTGSNALYRRRVFDLVGFNPSLREGEDVALNKAAVRHGLSFATVPGLLVEHIEHKTFPDSLRWLFVTGRAATRQLLTYRQMRIPDLATCAFVIGVAAGIVVAVSISPLSGAVIPVALHFAISTQHVRSRFEIPLARWRRVSAAITIDGALLLAYFAGRLAGLSWLFRHLPDVELRNRPGKRRPSGRGA
jgi:GT2 family glycosyltransferase